MKTDMIDRDQDPIFKQSVWPHSWDAGDNLVLHQILSLQRWGPVIGSDLEELYTVKKPRALLVHHLASPMK